MRLSGTSRALTMVLRAPLERIPPNTRLRILCGPLRGMRWIVGSANHVAWMGIYEWRKQMRFARVVRPGTVVLDIGAHVGFYTLLAARLVGPRGRVVAFEPLPRNLSYLREHLRINAVSNVQVVPAAVSDHAGSLAFEENASSYMGKLRNDGHLLVQAVQLDELVHQGTCPAPNYVKIDVEGGELNVLLGSKDTLRRSHPVIFLATHGAQVHAACVRLLEDFGYVVAPLNGRDIWHTDELIAWYPLQ